MDEDRILDILMTVNRQDVASAIAEALVVMENPDDHGNDDEHDALFGLLSALGCEPVVSS